MLTKVIDMALDATFLTIYNLSRLRRYVTVRKPADQEPIEQEEDARLVAAWIEACQKRDALQAELNHPSMSRVYETQARLLRTTKAAGAKCHHLLVELRAHRKG
jgi:hypothetical protein